MVSIRMVSLLVNLQLGKLRANFCGLMLPFLIVYVLFRLQVKYSCQCSVMLFDKSLILFHIPLVCFDVVFLVLRAFYEVTATWCCDLDLGHESMHLNATATIVTRLLNFVEDCFAFTYQSLAVSVLVIRWKFEVGSNWVTCLTFICHL